jgi:hypothetical protein
MSYDFSQIDFSGLKADLLGYIKEDAVFADYNFDGSALNSIVNLLAYITLQQNYYLNMTTKELYLDTATLYRNATAIARSLGYKPHRRIPAYLITSISFPDNLGAIEIPQYCNFKVNNIPFITKITSYATAANALEIELFQLVMKTETKTFDGSPIELLYGAEISNDDLLVKVNGIPWELYNEAIPAGSDSEIYFVNLNYNDKVEVVFGNGIFGKSPSTGATIDFVYGTTTGADGNSVNEVKLDQVLTDGSNFYADGEFADTIYSINGSNKETIESIKINAPKFYEAQNRAVTESDYKVLIDKLAFIGISNVWSGSENIPPLYGTVFITSKPSNTDLYLSDTQKTELYDYIKEYTPLSIRIQVVDPTYIYCNVSSKVYYYKSYGVSTTAIRANIESNINTFFTDNMTTFDSKLKYSNLVNTIDAPSEVSNNLTDLSYFVKFNRSPNHQYNIYLRNEILPGSINNTYIYDTGGIIYRLSDNVACGTIDYDTGYLEFIVVMDVTDNMVYFQTATDDAEFAQDNLPKLNNITITFVGV